MKKWKPCEIRINLCIRIIQLLLIVFKIAKINENNTTETYQILIFVKIDQG